MAQVTVQQLAETVGAPVDRLLTQMKEAGLPHSAAGEAVSEEDKQTLLTFLKRSHGESTAAPKRITLKRKTISTLRTSGSQGKKTVNVEVRKKRTYVKRDASDADSEMQDAAKLEAAALAEAERQAAEARAAEEAEAAEKAAREAAEAEEEAAVAAAAASVPEPEPEDEKDLDPEILRQRAAERRMAREAAEAEARKAAMEARKAEEERVKAEAAAKVEREKEAAAKRPKRLHDAPAPQTEEQRKKAARGRLDRSSPGGRGKQRGHNLSLSDLEAAESGMMRRRGGRKKMRGGSHAEHGKHGFEMPTEKRAHEVELADMTSVGGLAQQMSVKAGEVIKELMKLGVMATINQMIDQDTAILVVEEMGHKPKLISADALEEKLEETLAQHEGTLEPRAPVVTVMGHVDHGKTSLLDYIRKAKVASGEAGGITQHIGAYHVETGHGMISFLDTPGHAAFTAMRARGAKSTDIVILVVAADDGVMPQTEEAVQHAKAAKVPLIVAINKMDKEGADPDRVKSELAAREVIPEDWGGDTQFIEVSAHTGDGVDNLLDAVLLQAEVLELQAPRDVPAQGIVIESRLDKGRGPVASLLIQSGTLRQGDIVLAGLQYGRVRAMLDENGKNITEAGPSIPVEILGLDGTPDAGDLFAVVESEKRAREVAQYRQDKTRDSKLQRQQAAKLDNMFESMTAGEKKTLNVVVKADVRGSLEAIQTALLDLGNEEVQVNIVSGGVGGLAETDITLAITSSAVVFGFNVRADASARRLVENEGVDLRYYNVIYDLIDDVKQALTGMLAPEMREEILGIAEVRDVFRSPKFGAIAGCMVIEGTVYRSRPIRVLRDNVVIYQGELESLRRFKDDASEVRNGMECGIGVKNYNDVKPGDLIEVYEVKEFARTL
ncbi:MULTISPECIES: translation initiation factor IF-2 [Haliea]|jgi:translation initiation factor IF-2|uniref:translation initiation factor IF-2 n=1 Tax=Haliea TaxID=475794 RepID=UPI00042259B2|nr:MULTISPECIES: translation initiation factor IF-2 [Haliea]MAD64588.1 translation initiation factor IF-2 [Haliea sp.]MAY93086.1 translation initiation factor IF-2 [Haliea sp.]MBK39711.1 translation initiation factor IF-2 [Haliea sp.]MBP69496.1 translation initiation factor IF-2 [Haliea sp.]|tara:strand:- start:1651 stop:4332 length:2682 start_codon:yes stop_codon:yes gene_type:complete